MNNVNNVKSNILNKLSTLDVKCKHKLKEYVKFCLDNDSSEAKVDRHHILPRAVFEKYSNFTDNPWNMTRLSYKNHYIAHSLLHEAVNHYSIASAWYAMNNKNHKKYNGETLLGAELYSKLITKRNKQSSEFNKDKVMAKCLTTGATIKVTRDEFLLDDNLVGHTKGFGGGHLRDTVTAVIDGVARRIPKEDFDPEIHDSIGYFSRGKTNFRDSDGIVYKTSSEDPRVLCGELKHVSTNLAVYYDSLGNRISAYNYDPRVLSGELTHINKERSVYRHKSTGEIKSLFKDDPRVLSSEFVGINKGIVKCQDSNGNIIRIHKDDPRVISGELTRLTKDVVRSGVNKNRTLIYNSQDELVFDCNNNFGKICKENNLPKRMLSKTISENNSISFDFKVMDKSTITKYTKSGIFQYEGWYARRGYF